MELHTINAQQNNTPNPLTPPNLVTNKDFKKPFHQLKTLNSQDPLRDPGGVPEGSPQYSSEIRKVILEITVKNII